MLGESKGVPLARRVPRVAAMCVCAVFWRLGYGGKACGGGMEASIRRLRWHPFPSGRGDTLWVWVWVVRSGVQWVGVAWRRVVVRDGVVGGGRGGIPRLRRQGRQLVLVFQVVEGETQRGEGRGFGRRGRRGMRWSDGHGSTLRRA